MNTARKKQAFNPYLPSYEYIPDGEPHVFGERVYVYGSHDKFDGEKFCMNDYVCYSAPVTDLTDWRFESVIYKRTQDPRNASGEYYLWAPDVVKGLDGKYYLYYCLDSTAKEQIGVAVCDRPAGQYEFVDFVRDKQGRILGAREGDYIQFDPGVFIDDDGTIYLYSGNGPRTIDEQKGKKASQVMRLERDMVTLAEEPRLFTPTLLTAEGTGFEGHEFFEASSIRKWNSTYYFIYSSVNMHELCYAVSSRPDEGYQYGGVLISNCDVFPGMDIKDAKCYYGNNHGSLEYINGKWYIFYHRQTNRSNFSRQGCAEEIAMGEDGSFVQAKLTSCGLNGGPLEGKGSYETYISCHLRGKNGACISLLPDMGEDDPYLTQEGEDREDNPNQYIANMRAGAEAGFKYFRMQSPVERMYVLTRGNGSGVMRIASLGRDNLENSGNSKNLENSRSSEISENLKNTENMESSENLKKAESLLGEIKVRPSDNWTRHEGSVNIPAGATALYFTFEGEGSVDFKAFGFEDDL
ncbi:MAG: family 43 glycosylhydrolase [Clostridium sp.]|nr:family 43 glycosylhydrolase [Clostridium sp.]